MIDLRGVVAWPCTEPVNRVFVVEKKSQFPSIVSITPVSLAFIIRGPILSMQLYRTLGRSLPTATEPSQERTQLLPAEPDAVNFLARGRLSHATRNPTPSCAVTITVKGLG